MSGIKQDGVETERRIHEWQTVRAKENPSPLACFTHYHAMKHLLTIFSTNLA